VGHFTPIRCSATLWFFILSFHAVIAVILLLTAPPSQLQDKQPRGSVVNIVFYLFLRLLPQSLPILPKKLSEPFMPLP
jgi:hypothetical protein